MENSRFFIPSFGNRPHAMVGRDREIQDFLRGLESPAGSKERATLFLGQRGYGKTVLLLELAEQAKKLGYVVASPTVTSKGMLERIVEKIQDEGEDCLKNGAKSLVGGNLGVLGFSVGLQFEREAQESKSFTYKLSRLCRAVENAGKGILILVDEIQANNESLKELIVAYQELVGEGRNIAIAMAGLPAAVSGVLNDHILTFLNRARKVELGPLSEGDVDAYYTVAFAKMGITFEGSGLERAAMETKGSPYMMQLIGYYIAKYADESGFVSTLALDQAIKTAQKEFMNDICKTTLSALSETDIRFLVAMLPYKNGAKMADVAVNMQVEADYAQRYRRRLLDAGVIEQKRRGVVEYSVPFLRQYLEEKQG